MSMNTEDDSTKRSNMNLVSVGPLQALEFCHEIVNKTFCSDTSYTMKNPSKKRCLDRCDRSESSDMNLFSVGPLQALDFCHAIINKTLYSSDSYTIIKRSKKRCLDPYGRLESSDMNLVSVGSLQALDICHEIVNKTLCSSDSSYTIKRRSKKKFLEQYGISESSDMNFFSVRPLQALNICHEIVNKTFCSWNSFHTLKECSKKGCLDRHNSSESSDSDVAASITEFGSPLTPDSRNKCSIPFPKVDKPIMAPIMSTKISADEIDLALYHPECVDNFNSATHQSPEDHMIKNISVQIIKNETEKSNDENISNLSSSVDNNSNGSLKKTLCVDQRILLPNKNKYIMLLSSASPRCLLKTISFHLSDQNENVQGNSTTTNMKLSLRSTTNKRSQIMPERFDNQHFKLTNTKKDKGMNGNLIKKRGKKLRLHHQPFTTKKFDYFDESTMKGLQTKLSSIQNCVHNFIDYSRRAIKFQPEVIAKRTLYENKKHEILIRWFPSEMLDDEWITYDKNTNLSVIERIVPIMSMNAENRDLITNLFGNIFPLSTHNLGK